MSPAVSPITLSVVIPVYNEEENVALLHEEIKAVCEAQHYLYEIIIIDDGSTDQTAAIARQLSPVYFIRFRKNFGQTAALNAGVQQAQYPYIVTMDGDRQNDPKDIPNLLNALIEKDLDIVSGWRRLRKDTFLKHFVSRGANMLRKLLINDGINDSGCSLKVYRKECFDHITLYGEMHRFVPALLKIKGFKIGEIPVNHRPRVAGVTKYNWRRTVKGFVDMISVWFWKKFATRPLHLLGGIGLFLIFVGLLTGFYTTYLYFKGQGMSESAWPILTMFLILAGVQLFVSGLIADIVIKNYFETTTDVPYSIKEVVKNQ